MVDTARGSPLFSESTALRLATFSIGDDLFAIDIMRIREIARPLPITAVPHSPHGMVGVVNIRGRVLPLFDLRVRFGLPERDASHERFVRHVIVRLDGQTLAIVVDRMHDVIGVERADVRPGKGVLAGEAAEIFHGVVPVDGRLIEDEFGSPAGRRLALLLNLRRIIHKHDRLAINEILRSVS